MVRVLGGILLGALALAPAPAPAMCVHTSYRLLAFSSDGESVLLEEEGAGPEGGGSLAYLLLSATAPTATRFLLSSTYSPGDGSEPEAVSKDAFQKALKALADAVKKKRLAGVQIGAAGGRRFGLVTLQASVAKGTPLATTHGELAGGGLRISLKGKALLVSDKGGGSQALKRWAPRESIAGIAATIGVGGKLLVLIRDGGQCRVSLAVLHTASGKASALHELALPAR